MKTRITLQRSLYTFAFAGLAIASLGAPAAGQSSAKGQAAAVPAPKVQALAVGKSSKLGPASSSATGSLLTVPPTPTFEGDIVHGDDGLQGPIQSAQFRIALLDAPVVTWFSAPSQITLVRGEHMLIEIADSQPHLVNWTGATEIELGNFSSVAEFQAQSAGRSLVQAELTTPQGQTLGVASLIIEVAGPVEVQGDILVFGPGIKLTEDTARLSVVQVVPGITNTFIAEVYLCNAGSSATKFQFDVATSAPEGKAWSASAPAPTALLGPSECATVYVTFALLDTDPEAEPSDGDATLTLVAYGKHGILDVFGGGKTPAGSVQLLDVCFGCNAE